MKGFTKLQALYRGRKVRKTIQAQNPQNPRSKAAAKTLALNMRNYAQVGQSYRGRAGFTTARNPYVCFGPTGKIRPTRSQVQLANDLTKTGFYRRVKYRLHDNRAKCAARMAKRAKQIRTRTRY